MTVLPSWRDAVACKNGIYLGNLWQKLAAGRNGSAEKAKPFDFIDDL
jgi:hypothetical protein